MTRLNSSQKEKVNQFRSITGSSDKVATQCLNVRTLTIACSYWCLKRTVTWKSFLSTFLCCMQHPKYEAPGESRALHVASLPTRFLKTS